MNKKIFLGIVILAMLAMVVGVYCYAHPTHYAFCDLYVLGSTRDEIAARYGAFYTEEQSSATYRIYDDPPDLIMSVDNSLWYDIYFTNGVATAVKLRRGYKGG